MLSYATVHSIFLPSYDQVRETPMTTTPIDLQLHNASRDKRVHGGGSSMRSSAAICLAALVTALALITAAPPLARSAPSTSPGQLYGFGENPYGELASTRNNNNAKAANPTP